MGKKIENIYECLRSRILLDQVADKWTILILGSISEKPLRFNEIKRTVEGISQKTLTQSLRRLERSGLVDRIVLDGAVLGVEYSMTELGESLQKPFEAVFDWVRDHSKDMETAQKKFDGKGKYTADID